MNQISYFYSFVINTTFNKAEKTIIKSVKNPDVVARIKRSSKKPKSRGIHAEDLAVLWLSIVCKYSVKTTSDLLKKFCEDLLKLKYGF